MTNDENRKKRILSYAFGRFTALGYSGVTMEEIARAVGMGKATVYRLFPSKEALILGAIDYFAEIIEVEIGGLLSGGGPLEDKLSGFLQAVAGKLAAVRPEALEDIARSAPAAYEKIETLRRRVIPKNLVALLAEGKRNGRFDPAMDEILVAHIVIGAAQHLTEPDVLRQLGRTPEMIFRSLLSIVLRGCRAETP